MKEKEYVINAKCPSVVKENQVYCISVGVRDAQARKGDPYSLLITDTIIIKGKSTDCLTGGVTRNFKSYFHQSEVGNTEKSPKNDDREMHSEEKSSTMQVTPLINSIITRGRSKVSRQNENLEEAKKLMEHQELLAEMKQKELIERFKNGGFILPGQPEESAYPFITSINAYPNNSKLPHIKSSNKIWFDTANESIWIPLTNGQTPFHISCIKNISLQKEGRISLLRINFNVPGKSAKHANQYPKDTENQQYYIQEVSFRSSHYDHFEDIISDFKKAVQKYNPVSLKPQETGESLMVTTSRRPTLDDILMKPPISGKKCGGRLEMHKNGFRFKSRKNEEFDLLFSQVSSAFYQPCYDNDIVMIHFRLKSPVIINNKKTRDVQYYAQVGMLVDEVSDVSTNRKRTRTKSLDDENEDKIFDQRVMKLEKAFESFAAAVFKESNEVFEFEEPDLEDVFTAAFGYSSEPIFTTNNHLISLFSKEPLVVKFTDLEVAAFERTTFMNRFFDLVLIFKDYSLPVVMMSNISNGEKGLVKSILDSKDILMIESTSSFNWTNILKKLCSNLDEWVNEQGGWSYFTEVKRKSDDDVSQDDEDEDLYEGEGSDDSSHDDEGVDSEEGSDDKTENSGDDSEDDSEDDYTEEEEERVDEDQKERDSDRKSSEGGEEDSFIVGDDKANNKKGRKFDVEGRTDNSKKASTSSHLQNRKGRK